MENPRQVFCCYAHEDRNLLYELETHLSSLERQNVIHVWYDGDIIPGTEWGLEIKKHLNEAQIILLLISADFIKSNYCYSIEMQNALKRHKQGDATVIPIILRHVASWKEVSPGNILPLGKLQALPKEVLPVMSWPDRDQVWKEVVEAVGVVVKELPMRESEPPVEGSTPTPTEVLTPEEIRAVAYEAYNQVRKEGPQLDDSLGSNNGQWFVGSSRTEGSCTFKGLWIFRAKEYYIETFNEDYRLYKGLHEHWPALNNLLLEVRMRIVKGNEGGLIFRWHQPPRKVDEFYYFHLTTSGYYGLIRGEETWRQDKHRDLIPSSFSTVVNKGSEQNTIAVRASGSTIDLFVNGTFLNRFSEAIPDAGRFGFVSGRLSKVAFSHAKMWPL